MNKLKDIFSPLQEELEKIINVNELSYDINVPKKREYGDVTTNIALKASSILNKSPNEIANEIVKRINKQKLEIKKVEIANPGFINFFFTEEYLIKVGELVIDSGIDIIKKKKDKYTIVYNIEKGKIKSKRIKSYVNVLSSIIRFTNKEVKVNMDDIKEDVNIYKNNELTDKINIEGFNILKESKFMNDIDESLMNYLSISKTYNTVVDIDFDKVFLNHLSNGYYKLNYTLYRINNIISIFKDEDIEFDIKDIYYMNPFGKKMISYIMELKEILDESIKYYEPYKILNYIDDICEEFIEFDSTMFYRDIDKKELYVNLFTLTVLHRFIKELLNLLGIYNK